MQSERYLTIDEVYDDLCLKIENLDLMPGENISENALSKSYGVTRHIIRGAITRAKERGLLEVYPQRKTVVSLINMRYVENILFIRESIEQESLRRVMELGDEEITTLVKALKENIIKQKAFSEDSSKFDEFYNIDSLFHNLILKAVGKDSAMDLIANHYIHVRRWRNFESGYNTERYKEIIEEHENLVRAIESKDKINGRECLHRHLDTVTRLQDLFKGMQSKYFIFN